MDRRRAIKLLLAALFTAVLGALAVGSAARAGTDAELITLVSTKPVDGAVLTAAPSEIVLTFAERLPAIEPPSVQLQNESRELINIGDAVTIKNRTALRVIVNEPNGLPAGKYTFTWLIRPTNGKDVADKFTFELRAPDAATDDTGATGTDSSGSGTTATPKADTEGLGLLKSSYYTGLLGTLGRLLGYLGLAALFGGVLLIALAWKDGVEYVLTVKHLWLAWGAGVVGSLLTVATAAADVSGISIARGLVPTEWSDLLDSTFGKALVIRLFAIVGCAWVAARPEKVTDPSTRLMALGIPAIALATYGWSRQSAGVSALAIPAGMAHVAAGAAWFGGAALLTRVVLAGPGDRDLVLAIRGFRRIYLPAVLVVLLSGAVQTSIVLGGAGKLTSTTFGRIFLLKIVVVAAMAFIATANRQYARHRLAKARTLDARPAARLRRSVRSEVYAGTIVFLLAAWLAGTSAPGLASDSAATPTGKNIYESTDGSFRAEVKFGKTMVNAKVELHFKLLEPESIEDGLITFRPKDGKSTGIAVPIAGTPNYGFGTDQGFEFKSSGTWIITITGNGPNGPLPTITREFTVNNQDGSAPGTSTSTTSPSITRATLPPETTGG